MSSLKKLVYAAAPLALLILSSELLLAALGLGNRDRDASRGFDAEVRYLTPLDDPAGAFETRMMDGGEEVFIPPRSETVRVLLFGGSNTAGFPQGVLQAILNEERPANSKPFEVIKLGRAGYGSKRVSILFRQALEWLDPDVVVLYTGHNEFIEASFEMELASGWNALEAPLAHWASKLRTYRALVELADRKQPAGSRSPLVVPPAAWQWEYEKFRGYTYARTLERLDEYEANLEQMCGSAMERGVGVVLCSVVGNMLSAPFLANYPEGFAHADRCNELLREAEQLFPERYAELVPSSEDDRLHFNDWAASGSRAAEIPTLRALSGPLAEKASWLPPADALSDRAWRHTSTIAAFHRRELEADETAALTDCAKNLEAVLALAPRHPRAHFLLGLVRYLGDDEASARQHLELAGAFDCAPRRANKVTNDIVREVAERTDVHLADLDALYAERVPGGIVGFELFKDECHFHDAVMPVLMRDLSGDIRTVARSSR